VAVERSPPPVACRTVVKRNAAVKEATASPTISPSSDVATSDRLLPRRMSNMKLR
jgi:hypothetical protein